MNQRDTEILDNLKKFRVLDRDQIIKLHFLKNKDSVQSCNKVMKRLVRDGHISVDHSARPYNYFPVPSIRKDSTKIPHYKEIADFYLHLSAYKKPSVFEVEYKTGTKGSIEPDIFMKWYGTSFFVEIQRNIYTKKVMDAKLNRYLEYYTNDDWKENLKHFPHIWIITPHTYTVNVKSLKVYQTKNVCEFYEKILTKK